MCVHVCTVGTRAHKIQLIKHFDFQFEHCSVICESYLLEKNVNKPTNKRMEMKEEVEEDDDDDDDKKKPTSIL